MAEGRFVSYCRVSTAKQGESGLGLEAQKAAVMDYLNGGSWSLSGEFIEVESGANNARPQLARALDACRLTGAKLVIAKLDRLGRNVAFLANLMESGVDFVACDNPHATKFTIHILAAVAELEREMISKRTREALARSKKKLGGWRGGPAPDHQKATAGKRAAADAFAVRVLPTITALRQEGASLHGIAANLTSRGIRTPQGGAWTATAVRRVLARAN